MRAKKPEVGPRLYSVDELGCAVRTTWLHEVEMYCGRSVRYPVIESYRPLDTSVPIERVTCGDCLSEIAVAALLKDVKR